MKNCVALSDILIKRGSHTILQIDQLTIHAGEFVGLLGPNGAGKTTFLKLCCGLIKPNRGNVRFQNQCISRIAPGRIAHFRKHIGYIPQQAEYHAHLPFTLREVVAMGRNALKPLFHALDKTDYEIVDSWIDKMGLADRGRQTFRSLSGGQQQKALIARAMVAEPQFLLLDEPGANLDPNWKKQLRETLDRLFNDCRITALLISHELDLIPSACQRLILLDQGRIVQDGPKAQVINSDFARQLFGRTITTPEKP